MLCIMLAFLDYTHPLLVSSTPLAVLFVSELLSRFYLPVVERETSRLDGWQDCAPALPLVDIAYPGC
jgi:hypothetical protein